MEKWRSGEAEEWRSGGKWRSGGVEESREKRRSGESREVEKAEKSREKRRSGESGGWSPKCDGVRSLECDGVLDRSLRTEFMAEGLKYNCPESGDSKSTKSEV